MISHEIVKECRVLALFVVGQHPIITGQEERQLLAWRRQLAVPLLTDRQLAILQDQELRLASYLDDVWAGGESGEWWVCAINDSGLLDGLYEFELTVEGEFLNAESIFVGGNRQPATITISNESSDTICYVFISPTLSGYWGNDELGSIEVMAPLVTRVFEDLVTGRYDVLLRDCDLETLREWTGIELTGDELLVHVD